jgi:hypothetical protein
MGKKRVLGPRRAGANEEAWLVEWFEWGYRCLCAYLANQAAFDAWCVDHPTKET